MKLLLHKDWLSISGIIPFFFLLLCIVGIVFPIYEHRGVVTVLFELIIFLTIAFLYIKRPLIPPFTSWLLLAYLVLSALFALKFRDVYLLDFLQAYKAIYYLLLLSLIYPQEKFNGRVLDFAVISLLCVIAFGYVVQKIALGLDRPQLVVENNYELILLMLLVGLREVKLEPLSNKWLVVMAIIFLVAGSRSAIAAFVLYFFFFRVKFDRKLLIRTFFFVMLILMALYIFYMRLNSVGSIEDIDRVRFFSLFYEEMNSHGLFSWFAGTERITRLSEFTCNALAYYETLLSYEGDGSCYSVIFHAWMLRSIFDHGIIITVAILLFVYRYFYGLGYTVKQVLFLVSVLIVCGLSVSSLNSGFVFIGLAVWASNGNCGRQKSHRTAC